ncbi:hypothetical protein BJY00DRAFT_58645 [Aspergillus carlsbadensis]|nr:hypothetical protein BJY00DRAFT_58645 [Aspergillus carlsbadensis]
MTPEYSVHWGSSTNRSISVAGSIHTPAHPTGVSSRRALRNQSSLDFSDDPSSHAIASSICTTPTVGIGFRKVRCYKARARPRREGVLSNVSNSPSILSTPLCPSQPHRPRNMRPISLFPLAIYILASCTAGNAQTTEPGYTVLPEVESGMIITNQPVCLNTQLAVDTYRPCGEFSSNGQGGIRHSSWGWVTISSVNRDQMLAYDQREAAPALRWLYDRANPQGADGGYYGLCLAEGEGSECTYGPRWAVVGDSQYIAPYVEGADGYQEVQLIFSPSSTRD